MGVDGDDLIWKTVPGHQGLYEASNDGRIRSWNGGRWGRRAQPLVLAATANRWGYLMVHIGKHGIASVHRLVCLAFHGVGPAGAQAAHHDGTTLNNVPGNLAWKTPAENCADKVLHGTLPQGERHTSAKLTEAQVRDILAARASGERNMDVARRFGVAPQTVSGITTRKKWRHLEVA